MTLLAGWVGTTITAKDAERLLKNHIAQAPLYTQQGVNIASSGFYVFAADQHKIYLEQDILLLNAGNTELSAAPDKLIEKYQKKGESFLESSPTEQALVIIDQQQKKLILATDPIGLTQLYHAVTAKGFVFGTSADDIIAKLLEAIRI